MNGSLSLPPQAHTKPPVSLHGQLLWREFFYAAAAGTPNFHKMKGNPVSLQIPWDENKEFLDAWTWVSHQIMQLLKKYYLLSEVYGSEIVEPCNNS